MNFENDFDTLVNATCDDVQHAHAHGDENSWDNAKDRLKALEALTCGAVSVAAINRLNDPEDRDDSCAALAFGGMLEIWGCSPNLMRFPGRRDPERPR